jgi:two-component system response regulator YesN
MYKLLIIDDEPLIQAGIRSMVAWNEIGVDVCGVASNGQAGWEIMNEQNPDIIITDIKMPVMSGLELLKKTRETYPEHDYPAFIILTSYEEFQIAKDAVTYHATDYLVKLDLTPELLRNAVLRAIEGLPKNMPTSSDVDTISANDVQSFRDKFFIRLLHNLYDSPLQFELLKDDLNIEFSYKAYQCCYFEMQNISVDRMDISKQVLLYSNSYQLLTELTAKYLEAYFVTLDRKHGAIIILYENTPANDSDLALMDSLRQISNSLEAYYQTTLKIGIGTVVNAPLLISDSYQAARLTFSGIKSDTGISSSADSSLYSNTESHMVFNLSLIKDDLSKAFSEYDEELLYNVISQVITLFEEYPPNYVQALDAACNILFLSISLLPNGEEQICALFPDYDDNYRSIYRQNTTEQIIEWLNLFRDRLCESFATHKKEHRHHIVDNVKKYIELHITQKLSLNEVAAIYGISPNYLSALFKKYNNCGYSEYITEQKIAKAKRMLSEDNLKVYEVADALGFESAFYFSKVFKKVVGVSPSEYLNEH